MKWASYKVEVKFIATGVVSQVTVQAVSKNDALWRAINRRLDNRYEAISVTKVE